MRDVETYLNEILLQIRDSYIVITELKDNPGDLEIIKKELAKINGSLQVIIKKLDSLDNSADKYVELTSSAKYYLENYFFDREIETMSKLYSTDSDRLKSIRYTIITALQDKKLIEKIESIIASK